MKPARVDTKFKLEQLVQRLDHHNKRARLVEAGEAPSPAPAPAQAAPAAATKPAQQGPAGKPAQTPEQLPKKDDASALTVAAVVDQLNAIRAGKSFKDTVVQQELERYYEGLDDSEKEALHAYLKGLAQIVSGQVDAGQAEEPSNHGVETKAVGTKRRQIKPNIVKKSSKPAGQAPAAVAPGLGAPKEDTTPPSASPIVPKKR